MMQKAKWILLTVFMAGMGALAGVTSFYVKHHQTTYTTQQEADREFGRLRARFAGQQPLLDMRERRVSGEVKNPGNGAAVRDFHVVIFDTRDSQRMVRINLPYRLGRSFAGANGFRWLGQLTFLDDTEFDPEPIQLSLAQVARHGPGLLVDCRHASGGQFMAWVE